MNQAENQNNRPCITMAHMMMPQHANPHGNVHGGVIMKFIDDAAAVIGQRHTRSTVVTAAIDSLSFHRPVYIGNLLTLRAALNLTGKTSMEIGVRVEAEDLIAGTTSHIASAYLTFVAIDEKNHPLELTPHLPQTAEEERRHREALERRRHRDLLRKQNKSK
ncbi:MAG: acyl-CoA thioesterase [Desulfobulbaceae bacterium]|uniref:Acyl-CoA thioesterase n=1 Tax=Candidatus Desulfatifera sulfidica TaxID=2841691 RepID=A0A8J6TEF5_9BACT|nr:acyl-CoA thioesterase [Candidatus Desulfatifera sulfidica]